MSISPGQFIGLRAYITGTGSYIQTHPTAISGAAKLCLMSNWRAGEGASKPTGTRSRYSLEEKYPVYGNLVKREIATREIFNICVDS